MKTTKELENNKNSGKTQEKAKHKTSVNPSFEKKKKTINHRSMFLVLMKKSELKIYEELRWSGLLGSKNMTATKPDHFFKSAVVLFRDKHLPQFKAIFTNIRKLYIT